MPILLKTNGIVLSSKILPSNDVIYIVLTEEKGKLRIFGKGVKKTSSRRRPHLQTGNLISAVLRRSNETYYLQETTRISAFSQIKQSSEKLGWLYAFLFMIDRLLPEMEKDQHIYNIVQKHLIDLAQKKEEQAMFTESANSVLSALGYTSEKISLEDIKELFTDLTHQKLPLNTI